MVPNSDGPAATGQGLVWNSTSQASRLHRAPLLTCVWACSRSSSATCALASASDARPAGCSSLDRCSCAARSAAVFLAASTSAARAASCCSAWSAFYKGWCWLDALQALQALQHKKHRPCCTLQSHVGC